MHDLRHRPTAPILALGLALLGVALLFPATASAQSSTDDASGFVGTFDLQRSIPVALGGGERPSEAAVAVQRGGGRNWYIGVRGGAYFEVDEPFIGVELLFPLGGRLWFNPNFEWVFVDRRDVASLNADLHYDLDTSGAYMFWLGAGLGLRYNKLERPGADGDWDPGLNLLAGVGFGSGGFVPYIQAKYYIGDFNEFVLAGGFRF